MHYKGLEHFNIGLEWTSIVWVKLKLGNLWDFNLKINAYTNVNN